MSFNERYAKEESKTFTPPEGVQSAARKALKWIEEGHAGKALYNFNTRLKKSSFEERYIKEAFGPDLHTSLEIGKAGWSALHGVGQVLKDTFMFPANAAESVKHFVHEVSTGDIPNPPKNDYYGWGPQHFTKTEVGGAALYPVKRGLEKVVNKGLDLKDRYDQAMHPEDRAKRMPPPTAAKFKSCTNCDNSVPANTLDSEGKCKDGCKASMQRMRDRASENLFWNE